MDNTVGYSLVPKVVKKPNRRRWQYGDNCFMRPQRGEHHPFENNPQNLVKNLFNALFVFKLVKSKSCYNFAA